MDFKFKIQNTGQTKVLGSWPLAKGHVSSPLSFIQSLSQGVAKLSQIVAIFVTAQPSPNQAKPRLGDTKLGRKKNNNNK